jgi:hypothetical protein
MENATPLFAEKQRFNPWIVGGLFVLTTSVFCFGSIQQVFFKIPFGDHPMSNAGLLLFTCTIVGISALFLGIRLETKITSEAIFVRFFPIHWRYRTYAWKDIASVSVRSYSPILEYGGWGIRGIGKNRALNVAGKKGLQLTFHNGKKLLIGTQQATQLQELLETNGFIPK